MGELSRAEVRANPPTSDIDELVALWPDIPGTPLRRDHPAPPGPRRASDSSRKRTQDGLLAGIAYGYLGAPGQWWHDIVAGAMTDEQRRRWLRPGPLRGRRAGSAPRPARAGASAARLHDALLGGPQTIRHCSRPRSDNDPRSPSTAAAAGRRSSRRSTSTGERTASWAWPLRPARTREWSHERRHPSGAAHHGRRSRTAGSAATRRARTCSRRASTSGSARRHMPCAAVSCPDDRQSIESKLDDLALTEFDIRTRRRPRAQPPVPDPAGRAGRTSRRRARPNEPEELDRPHRRLHARDQRRKLPLRRDPGRVRGAALPRDRVALVRDPRGGGPDPQPAPARRRRRALHRRRDPRAARGIAARPRRRRASDARPSCDSQTASS